MKKFKYFAKFIFFISIYNIFAIPLIRSDHFSIFIIKLSSQSMQYNDYIKKIIIFKKEKK